MAKTRLALNLLLSQKVYCGVDVAGMQFSSYGHGIESETYEDTSFAVRW